MRDFLRKWLAATLGTVMLLTNLPIPAVQAAMPPTATGAGDACAAGAPVRTYNIHAIEVDMTFNKYGLHDPNGRMYVLEENRQQLLEAVANNPGKTVSLVQPLAIRANVGDCVEVNFVNELQEKASIHPTGMSYDVLGSDGAAAGWNPDSTAAAGATVKYRWSADMEGTFFFDNGADVTYSTDPTGRKGSRSHGLFGAMIVEPAGATWTHPRTGEALPSGVQADIHLPNEPHFREIVIFYHDGVELEMQDGTKPLEPLTGEIGHNYDINYRGEPDHLRYPEACPDCALQSQFYSSWVHGDPGGGDLVFPVYKGDPVRFRIIGAQTEENHVHHLHVHRWKATEADPASNTIDSQTIGPGATYTQILDSGAGYKQGAVGDVLFHCHLFPHYFDGMWAIMRVLDKQQTDVKPLPDRVALAAPTAAEPGYPNFVPGRTGFRPPHPPDLELRPPLTEVERTAMKAMVPGAPYTDPCPVGAPVRHYDLAAIQLDFKLNSHGDRTPGGRMYVQLADKAAVLSGQKKPEPLVLRANKNDCVTVTLQNDLPSDQNYPNYMERLDEISMHIHFVAFDVLGSDGTSVGFNYDEGILPGEKIHHRWYANEEGSIFFHDHQSHSAGRGSYGMLAVEPTGSQWVSAADGTTPVTVGTKAVIMPPGIPSYREYALFYADNVPGVDKNGKSFDPPKVAHSAKDQGVSAINYTNEPFYHRTSADPAYVFNSFVYGEPSTPLLETYHSEPVKLRLITGTTEEMHNFVMHGLSWQRDPHQPDMVAQTVSVSEQFNFDVKANPSGVPERDYLYGSMNTDDLWKGMWGLFRVWGVRVPWLSPLPETPKSSLTVGNLLSFYRSGTTPKTYAEANNPCPTGAPEKAYDVVAFNKDIQYNRYGDHDPYGIVYSLAEDEAAMQSGVKPLEPLVLRANSGDCVVVHLTNKLPLVMSSPPDEPRVPIDSVPWKNSNRISLHPQLVQYDVETSDGAAVGWNFDSTVGPGGTKTYRWYAPKENGTTILWDAADIRSHRHHGAYGMLIIEPKDATYLDPKTGQPVRSGAIADIVVPGVKSFREAALSFVDGAYIVNPSGKCVLSDPDGDTPTAPCNQKGDPENQGFKAVNYRSAPLAPRLPQLEAAKPWQNSDSEDANVLFATSSRVYYRSNNGTLDDEPLARDWSVADGQAPLPPIFSRRIPEKYLVFSSHVHGDPDTPIFRAYAGDPTMIRLAVPGDKPRGVNFHLSQHLWERDWTNDPTNKWSPYVGVQPQLTPGVVANIDLYGGAGGSRKKPGDFVYQDEKLKAYVESGLWGIFRVLDYVVPDLKVLPGR